LTVARPIIALGTCALAVWCQTAHAGPIECHVAVDSYNSAIESVFNAVRQYMKCMADREGHDDCSSLFRQLQGAQDDFESAVATWRSECRQPRAGV
jgi:hypothetical protein